MAKRGIDARLKVVDLSAGPAPGYAGSIRNAAIIRRTRIPELLPTAYGLPEINRAEIAGADVVADAGLLPNDRLAGECIRCCAATGFSRIRPSLWTRNPVLPAPGASRL